MDVESLQKNSRRRTRCLDVFLVVSIIFLFGALAAVAVSGVRVVAELDSKLSQLKSKLELASPPEALKQTANESSPVYKMENFAYLEPISSSLQTSTMQFEQVNYAAEKSIGSNFAFDKEQNSLQPLQTGSYFMYIELNLTCTYDCGAGLLTVQVGNHLTCEVTLPKAANSKPVSKKCWTVSWINKEKLFTQMTVTDGVQNWRLELNSSKLGLFLVD
ncbi:hypothetical protein D9C73_003059 [Collichthys lucidus]|uniref:TNF family profile domain-containing protein n=1 Tax=Collichthys lucidus TaxID=240159 RepID=A0A4U5U7L1_COLLU|nr:hypothetical protein D9C73_003059 [Collichthys lucidus]